MAGPKKPKSAVSRPPAKKGAAIKRKSPSAGGRKKKRRADFRPQPKVKARARPIKKGKAKAALLLAEGQVTESRKAGRKPELTPIIHTAIMLAIATGMPETRVGPLIKMDKSIVGKWKDHGRASAKVWDKLTPEERARDEKYVEFFEDLSAALHKFEMSKLDVINSASDNGDWRAADRLLKLKFPEYRETVKVSADEENPIHFRDLPPMTDDERRARVEKARKLLDETDGD